MPLQIRIGDRARTRGPLKPTGQIRLGKVTLAATSAGEWIDGDTDVEVVAGSTEKIVVRRYSEDNDQVGHHGQLLARKPSQPEPCIQSPPAWVETINPTAIGFIGGAFAAILVWMRGVPLDWPAASVPIAGAASGWCFRKLVGIAAESAGPYSDHRPMARTLAIAALFTTLLGGIIGFNVSQSFLGTSIGLVLGTVAAGIATMLLLTFSHL